MSKEPAYLYYPSDWHSSPASLCSLAARGLWREMMDMMYASDQYGYLTIQGRPISDEVICRYAGCSLSEYAPLVDELFSHNVPRRTSSGIIYSHRMVKDHKERQLWRKRKKKQRLQERDVTPVVTPMSRRLSFSLSSSIQEQKQLPVAARAAPGVPLIVPEEIWAAFLEHRKKLRAPLTAHGIDLLLRRLLFLQSEGYDPVLVVEQSIERGWKGLFGIDGGSRREKPPLAALTAGQGPSAGEAHAKKEVLERIRQRQQDLKKQSG